MKFAFHHIQPGRETRPAHQPTIASIVLMLVFSVAAAADEPLPDQARTAMRRAVDFFRHQVAAHGGYVYLYSEDLTKREGEGKTDSDTVWVQPPGTPTVGMAYLVAYERTGEPYLLEAARETATCLIQGQLRSGGWTDRIDFAADKRLRMEYRVDPAHKKPGRNWTTFDDNKTQSALRFLMRLDRTLRQRDKPLHEATAFALEAVLRAQFPNGAWPQGFEESPPVGDYPVKSAGYPEEWPRTAVKSDYWRYYTFNDNAIGDTIDMLFLAADIYQDPRYRDAAIKAGEFILLAQMPEPQPAWAQQYDFNMHPVWARKFEPPAVSAGESQGIIRSLLQLFEETGERKFLTPIPQAIAYLRSSALADGRLARFYELRTNKPLYFDLQYNLTYGDQNMPTHYAFKVSNRLDALERSYRELAELSDDQLRERREAKRSPPARPPSATQLRAVISQLDERGAWVEDGRLRYHGSNDPTRRIISSDTFVRHLDVLSRGAMMSQRGK